MSEPTRKDIIYAHETLEYLVKNLYDMTLEAAKYTRSYNRLIKFLPPIPPKTMEEIEWDENMCFLAEAEHPEYGKVVMLKKDTFDGNITVLYKDEDGFKDILCTNPKYLTPTDTKYVLLEM